MITHSLADLDSLATEEDRAKARGFIDRSAIKVLAALPPRELEQLNRITPLTGPEQQMVAGWSAPDSWRPGARHPGRGKYLIKTGGRSASRSIATWSTRSPPCTTPTRRSA